MTRKHRRKRKHWRSYLVNNLLPARFQLVEYKSLIDTIVNMARGNATRPLDIYRRFYKSLTYQLTGSSKASVNASLILKNYSTRLLSLQKEDLEQQCFLYLMELWDFFTFTWNKHGAASTTVFYDFARTNLSRWMAIYVANEIKNNSVEGSWAPLSLESYEMEDPQIFKLDLGWVILKTQDGRFSQLTTKQKYLLYLRWSKELTIDEISVLIKQHRAKIEQDFSLINKLLYGGQRAVTRIKSQEPK